MDIKEWIIAVLQAGLFALVGYVWYRNDRSIEACQTRESCKLIHAGITQYLDEMRVERKEITESLKRIELKLAYQNGCESRKGKDHDDTD